MTFLNEPIHKIDPTVDVKTLRSRDYAYASASAARDPSSAGDGLDPETREVVERFEALYADVAPPTPAVRETDGLDELRIELPDDPPRDASVARHDTELRQQEALHEELLEGSAPLERVSGRSDRPERGEPEIGLDEAMALLRAGEGRSGTAAPPAPHVQAQVQPIARTDASRTPRDRQGASVSGHAQSVASASARETASDTTHSTGVKIIAAGAIALILGAGLGFIAATTGGASTEAKIPVTAQGGTQLRLERELSTR